MVLLVSGQMAEPGPVLSKMPWPKFSWHYLWSHSKIHTGTLEPYCLEPACEHPHTPRIPIPLTHMPSRNVNGQLVNNVCLRCVFHRYKITDKRRLRGKGLPWPRVWASRVLRAWESQRDEHDAAGHTVSRQDKEAWMLALSSFLPLSSVLDSSHDTRYPHSEWTFLTRLHLSGNIPRDISRSMFSRES